MKLRLRYYDSPGYQDDGAGAVCRFIEADILSEDGAIHLNLGRLFFTDFGEDSTWAKLEAEATEVEIVNELPDRERSGNVRATAAK